MYNVKKHIYIYIYIHFLGSTWLPIVSPFPPPFVTWLEHLRLAPISDRTGCDAEVAFDSPSL